MPNRAIYRPSWEYLRPEIGPKQEPLETLWPDGARMR